MADCDQVSSESSSSSSVSSNPTPPPPKHRRSSTKKPSASGKYHKEKHSSRRSRDKRKSKGKRKHVTSSSSASLSNDNTDPNSSDDTVTPKKQKLKKPRLSKKGSASSLSVNQHLLNIFRRHYFKLETMTSTCVHTITSKLYSSNMISEAVQDQVITSQESDNRKASKVLHSVKQRLKVDPGKLRELIEVLQEEPVFDDLTKAMMSEC